jgi:hypothetical protein
MKIPSRSQPSAPDVTIVRHGIPPRHMALAFAAGALLWASIGYAVLRIVS